MNSSGIALEGLGCPSSLSDMMSWPLEGCAVGQGWTEYPDISFTLYASIASMGAQMPITMKFLNIISITVLVLYYYKTKTTHTQLDFNTLSITLYHTGRSDSVVSKWTFQATCSVQLWTFSSQMYKISPCTKRAQSSYWGLVYLSVSDFVVAHQFVEEMQQKPFVSGWEIRSSSGSPWDDVKQEAAVAAHMSGPNSGHSGNSLRVVPPVMSCT